MFRPAPPLLTLASRELPGRIMLGGGRPKTLKFTPLLGLMRCAPETFRQLPPLITAADTTFSVPMRVIAAWAVRHAALLTADSESEAAVASRVGRIRGLQAGAVSALTSASTSTSRRQRREARAPRAPGGSMGGERAGAERAGQL